MSSFILVGFLATPMVFGADLHSELTQFQSDLQKLEKMPDQKEVRGKIKSIRKYTGKILDAAQKTSAHDMGSSLLFIRNSLVDVQQNSKGENETFNTALSNSLSRSNRLLALSGAFHSVLGTHDGLRCAIFRTPDGDAEVRFPSDLQAGDSVLVTVAAQWTGSYRNYELQAGAKQLAVNESPSPVDLSPDLPVIPVILQDEAGAELARIQVPVGMDEMADPAAGDPCAQSDESDLLAEKPPVEPLEDLQIPWIRFRLPQMAGVGDYLQLSGSFDPKAAETVFRVGNRDARIAAVSPRMAVIKTPVSEFGFMPLSFTNGEQLIRCRFYNLWFHGIESRHQIQSGEHKILTYVAEGLRGIQMPVAVRLENRTPDVISLENGSTQIVMIKPDEVADDGTFRISRKAVGLKTGSFDISTRIENAQSFNTCDPP
ncbi:MAG TPA: hypothetical protein VFG11_09795 [Acidobacteriota bacterium]|nr:hypothetical protein [Acidobacteriota bacterium]